MNIALGIAGLIISGSLLWLAVLTRRQANTPTIYVDENASTRSESGQLIKLSDRAIAIQNRGPKKIQELSFEAIPCSHGRRYLKGLRIFGHTQGKGRLGSFEVGEVKRFGYEILQQGSAAPPDYPTRGSLISGHFQLRFEAKGTLQSWVIVTEDIDFRHFPADGVAHCPNRHPTPRCC